jgi:hypothetical protein
VDVRKMLGEISSQDLTDWHAFIEIQNEGRRNGGKIVRVPTNRDVFGTLKRAFPGAVRKKK